MEGYQSSRYNSLIQQVAKCVSSFVFLKFLQVVNNAILVADWVLKRLQREGAAVKRQAFEFRLEPRGCLLSPKVLCPFLVGDVELIAFYHPQKIYIHAKYQNAFICVVVIPLMFAQSTIGAAVE